MSDVWVAHTWELEAAVLTAARDLLHEAFEGDFTDADWEHALGGVHALVWEEGDLIGHASVVQRRMLHGGRAWRTGYVEGVGVRPDRHRRGHAAAMLAALERVVRGAYDLGALASSEQAVPFYTGRGWQPWQGPTSALSPDGVVRTEGEDIFVLPVEAALDLTGDLTCDWRDGDLW